MNEGDNNQGEKLPQNLMEEIKDHILALEKRLEKSLGIPITHY
jgi:hypothetical protein